jgi:hypothetical protein
LDFGIASDDSAEPATPKPILPPDPLRNSRNFRLNDDVASHIAEGGSKARIQHNLDILELLKSIQAEQRVATADEQNRIAQYIDFGGLRELWDQGYRYYEERNRLAEILTEDEIDAVKETSLNTHYTAIEVVDQMWAAANRLGFTGGRVLEPGMGVGNFFARIPDQLLHESELFGVEKNPLSGALASMLYPDAKILVQPFEDTRLPNNSFDMVIGNPLALEKIKLEYEIKNLTLLARSNRLDHYNNRQQLLNVEYRIAHLQDRLPQLKKASETFKSHERRDDEGKLLSLQVRFNGLEFTKLKDANEYLRTVTLDSTSQLTVNGLDIPLAVSDALIKDELGTITDITAVRYNLAGEWFDVPRPEAHMGLPSAQSLLTSVLRRGGDLPSKILETEATIQGSEATLARLHSALNYESPYEAKLKEYEQRLAVIDKELLGKTEEVEELVDAETEELPLAKALSVELESTDSEERTPEEPTEDRSATQVAVDDAPGEALEVPAKQTPRFRRRQAADRGR